MFVVPIILLSLSLISGEVAGFFLGTNAAYLLIIRKGLPEDTGSKKQRVLRVFISLMIIGLSSLVLDIGFGALGMAGYPGITLIEFLNSFIPAFTIWISVSICVKLNLYRRICLE
jgi:hypothetical protein